ncbi:MAG: glycerol-3-phosphate dehydrogenase/oxidase [Polyangiaceae bacterium]
MTSAHAASQSPASEAPASRAKLREDGHAPPEDAYDVAVIGGGVNGTGVARDLALRGLSVVLFERHDLGFGASGNSSGMIHGGPRYLLSRPKVTEASCRDSGYVHAIAPHLLFRIPFIMTIPSGTRGKIMIELVDAYFRAYDDYQPLKRGEPHTRLDPSEVATLEPGLVGAMTGGITFDEWGVDGGRLCVANAIDAREHGATLHLHTTVEAILATRPDGAKDGHRFVVVGRSHAALGESGTRDSIVRVRAKHVVNATGAWAPLTAAFGGMDSRRVRVRPGKGIHVVFDRRITNYAIASETIDGRQIFVEPWQNTSILGTTDDDYYGDLDDVRSTSEEVRYLVQGIARVFPAIRQARAIGTYAGVRPTLHEYGPTEDALSREHAIVDHGGDGAKGLWSMIGGKLASFRSFSEEMSDRIAGELAPTSTCTTHRKPLPGGDAVPDAKRLAERTGATPVSMRRLVYRHGSRADRVLERIAQNRAEGEVVCPCEPVTHAEIRHVVREEDATSVADVSRRTRLGLGACGGMRCAIRCGQIVAQERGLAPRDGLRAPSCSSIVNARCASPRWGRNKRARRASRSRTSGQRWASGSDEREVDDDAEGDRRRSRIRGHGVGARPRRRGERHGRRRWTRSFGTLDGGRGRLGRSDPTRARRCGDDRGARGTRSRTRSHGRPRRHRRGHPPTGGDERSCPPRSRERGGHGARAERGRGGMGRCIPRRESRSGGR